MSLQDVVARNQKVIAAVALLVLVAAIVSVLRSTGVVRSKPSIYHYNLQTGEIYAAPSGSGEVVAHVYACSNCDDDADRFVAYLQKLTDEARAESVKELPDLDILTDGQLIARFSADELKWVPLNSAEGGDITGIAYTKCENPVACSP